MNYKFKLGDTLQDKVSGFKGIASSRVQYLNGCVQYCIVPKVGKDGKYPEGVYFDEGQLKRTGRGINIASKKTGGAMRHCPKK